MTSDAARCLRRRTVKFLQAILFQLTPTSQLFQLYVQFEYAQRAGIGGVILFPVVSLVVTERDGR